MVSKRDPNVSTRKWVIRFSCVSLRFLRSNFSDHFVIDANHIPEKKLLLASGHVLFEEIAAQVRLPVAAHSIRRQSN
jgi:hypothetical protein